MTDIFWKLHYDINLPTSGKVKVHDVTWDPDSGMLLVSVSTSDTPADPDEYEDGVPLYEMDPEEDRYALVGMNPLSLGDPPQSLVKDHNVVKASKT